MRPQVSLSLHLEDMVRMTEIFVIHTLLHLVLMVIYMYVTGGTTEFKIVFVLLIMIVSSVACMYVHDHLTLVCTNSFDNANFEQPIQD